LPARSNITPNNDTNVLHPGAFLLGNNGMCYECGHDHSRGDRCIALHIAPNYFEEIAASSTSMGYRFPTGMLPAMPGLLPQAATMEAFATSREAMSIEEDVPRLIEAVLGVVSGSRASPVRASVRDERRVSEILHFIEENASEALELDELASKAGMSKYHFLRSFRRTAGITPYQFLLNVRLRRTAVRLATTQMPISAVAFEEGLAISPLSTTDFAMSSAFHRKPFARGTAPLGAELAPVWEVRGKASKKSPRPSGLLRH
jgi:AraC family transcriptional regulator